MKQGIKNWLQQWGSNSSVANSPDLNTAAAALLYEVAISDYDVTTEELGTMRQALSKVLQLDLKSCDSMLANIEQLLQGNTSLHPFTSAINQEYSAEEKRQLMLALWQVAYADGKIDKYEEHYLRNVADLLYIPHSVFIQTKLKAAAE